MNLQRHKLAPYGMYLAIVAAAAAGVLYILRKTFDLPVQIALGMVLVGIALAVLLDPRRARELLTGRQARYGSNALLMTLAVFGILVVVNYLAYKNPARWDLTENKEFTLSSQSIDIVKSLKEPVTAVGYFTPSYPSDTASKLLDSYKFAGDGKFDYQFIDPVQNPVKAQADKVTRDGTIVLKMGSHQEQVMYADEQELSSALLKLANPGERVIYFTTGHGEFALDASGDTSYSTTRSTLENKNYTVKSLNLVTTPKVPEDAKAVIIAGARSPLSADEMVSLKSYIDAGGALVVLAEPNLDGSKADQKNLLAEYLSSAWGIQLQNDLIIDPQVNSPVIAVADPDAYGSHAITQKLQQMNTIFPTAQSMTKSSDVNGVSIDNLLVTYASAWGETNLSGVQNSELTYDKTKDIAGPLTFGMAATNSTSKARLVVIGDADFASDAYFASYANGDMIVNSVDWAAQQENLLNLTPKQATQRMILSPQNFSIGLVLLLSIVLVPGGILAAGIMTWLQRRRRG